MVVGVAAMFLALLTKSMNSSMSGTSLDFFVFSSLSSLRALGSADTAKEVMMGAASNCLVHFSPDTALYMQSASLVNSALLDFAGCRSARVLQCAAWITRF